MHCFDTGKSNAIFLCLCIQGVGDGPSDRSQNGVEGQSEVKVASSKRLYNWNTTHFYPDVHKLDNDGLSVSHQRRHSEPQCFLRFADNVSDDHQSYGSSSSLSSVDEVKGKQDTTMPVSQLTVHISALHTAGGSIAKVDVDLDSGSESEDEAPKTWHRSPLHFRRGRRLDITGRSGKTTDTSVSAGVAGELWKQAADRPSIRLKEQAEKRRKFLHQRCQMYGWDLTSDQEKHTAEEERQQCAATQSQEDIRFIDQSPENSLVNLDRIEHSTATASAASFAVKDYIRRFQATDTVNALAKDSDQCDEKSGRLVNVSNSMDVPTNVSVKDSSSFENIYDAVSLEPEKTSDDIEVVQLYEPREAVFSHTQPLTSSKLPHVDLQPSVRRGSYKPDDRNNIANASMNLATCNVGTSRPSSAPSKSMQRPSIDAKSIVEEEKLKFVEYRIEYHRQHSSGNESGSGKSDGEKDARRQPQPVSKSHKTIPPDDYEYILRKIHYNRPQNKTDHKPTASQPYSTNQGSELHIEIKKPQIATRHITVDVAKPSVPHRVESLQRSLEHHLPVRPDVIPSPNYPPKSNISADDFADSVDADKDVNLYPDRPSRTVLRSDRPSVSTEPSPLPAADENSVYQWDSGIRMPEHFSKKPQYEAATSINVQCSEPGRKPPKPPRSELPRNRSPDFWNYNTTYEPSYPSLQPQPSQSMLSKEPEMRLTSETQHKDYSANRSDQDVVRDLVRGLDENTELTPEATAVFREQYRWSIHEPCRSVKPDQLKHHQPLELPCSQVFASSICVPSKPVKLVGQIDRPSSKNSGEVRSRKETVFSVTGFHRPEREKSNGLSQNIHGKDDRMYCSYSDARDSYSNDSVKELEPLYWYSEADKRKPIINSREVETALNRDSQQRYFCSSGQPVDDENLTWESSGSRRECSEVDSGLTRWKRDLCHRENYVERDVHKDLRPLGQKSQDRLVQQMSLGNQEVTGHLYSNSSSCATSFPVSARHNVHVHAPSDRILTKNSSTSRSCRQPPTEVGQQKDIQCPKTSYQMPSRASTDYEKHILRGQESYRSQVMAKIEPSTAATSCAVQDKIRSAKNCQNMTGIFTSHDTAKGCSAGRMAGFEVGVVRHSDGNPSDRFLSETHDKKFGKACLTNQEKCDVYEDDDSYPVSVAEIKAKLFGPSEDGARKLFQRQSDAVKLSETGRGGCDSVSNSNTRQKKRSFTSDELMDFEKLVEKLNKGDAPSENHSKWSSISSSMSSAQCSAADDSAAKRLSITNIKMLEGSRGKQSPSLEYAKEWLINGRHASASVISGKPSEHMLSSRAVEENIIKSAAHNVPPVENVGSFISHKNSKSLPCTESDDVCQPVPLSNVSSSSMNEVSRSRTGMSSAEGSVLFRSCRAGPLSSNRACSSNSFVRRSLPALSEKDAERWRNMVSRIQENESRKAEKSHSVERLYQTHCDLHMRSDSALNVETPVGLLPPVTDSADQKLAMSTQPLLHSTPDIMVPTDPVSLRSKRQQTPRDVKCRDEFRMRGIRAPNTSADSGYLGSGSDSRGSSGADVSQPLPSESNESEELELHHYACDEEDNVKLTNVDSAFSLGDKNDARQVSLSEYKVTTESSESRAKHLQKLREDWFGKNISQSHSSSVSDKHDSLNTSTTKLHSVNNNVGFEHSESSKFEKSVPSSLGLPKGNPARPLYISPLVQTSGCGIYRTPSSVVTGSGDDRSCAAVDSAPLSSPSKISSFKMTFPSQGHGQNMGSGDQSSVTSQASKVTHIPVRAAGLHSGRLPMHSSAFSPYADRKDLQVTRTSVGSTNITETKKESIHVEPEQYNASRLLERIVDQPSLKTYQRASEQFRHERQELKEANVKITRQVTDSKVERTYRIESHLQPKAPQLSARNELDKCETSDGEMTDATDITLDVMVGANQSSTPTAVDFSDVEFLSSANLPPMHDTGFMKGNAKPCLPHPLSKDVTDARVIGSDDGSGCTAAAAAKAQLELYKKKKKEVKTDDGEHPVERRRSIKELVHSFEGLTSPFMRVRPRSMEIRLSSSSEEENQDDSVSGKKRKNITLRASSSFKEASRLDRRNRQQTGINH